jgi:FdhE protein
VSPAGPAAGLSGGGDLGEVHYLRPHPGAPAVFARRSSRLAALAPGHAAGDYLALLARVARAQRVVAERLRLAPRPPAAAGVLPLDLVAPPPAWREALGGLLSELHGVEAPPPVGDALERLGRLPAADLDLLAERVLAGCPGPLDVPVAPFAGAALQVAFTSLAAGIAPAAVARVEEGCPLCGSSPTVGVVLGDDKLRYLVCGLCATWWHHTRARCVLCRSSAAVTYLALEGAPGPARAEACDGCQAYLKLLYVEQGPQLEPLADDAATLALDLMVGERGYRRLGLNLYLGCTA